MTRSRFVRGSLTPLSLVVGIARSARSGQRSDRFVGGWLGGWETVDTSTANGAMDEGGDRR